MTPQAKLKTKAGDRVRRKLTESPKIMARALAMRTAKGNVPIVLDEDVLSTGKLRVFLPTELTKLNVDERYQRVRIKVEVNELIHVLTSGGTIPDPISVAQRPDGSLWIVDGQQRFWAHSEAKKPLTAMIYAVSNFEAEQRLFLVLNQRRQVGSNYIAKSWPGETGDLLRKFNDLPQSALHNRINFAAAGSGRPFSATILVRALAILLGDTESAGHGNIQSVLKKVDHYITRPGARTRAELFLELCPRAITVQPQSTARVLAIKALATVARRRWAGGIVPPPAKTLTRLSRVDWSKIAGGSHAEAFLVNNVAAIEQRWPKEGMGE